MERVSLSLRRVVVALTVPVTEDLIHETLQILATGRRSVGELGERPVDQRRHVPLST